MKSSNPIGKTFATFSGTLLICGVTALAQAPGGGGGGGGMQSPSSQNRAGDQSQMNSMTTGQPSSADRTFVQKALQGGMAEIQLGQLALQKSSNDDVKQFAQKMIDDHTKLGDQMKPIAQQIGVTVPDGPSKKDTATMAKMQTLSGDAFDKAYVKDMVKDHKMDLAEFKDEAQNGSAPAVKDAASQGSPIISQHLTMIQQIAQKQGSMASK